MSRRSSRSSRSTRWQSTPKLAQADISLVFADSVQVGTSPGAAVATLPRQSTPQSHDNLSHMNTLNNDRIQDNTFARFVSRSSTSLLSTMYSTKRQHNSTVIPRVERVIQPELCPNFELKSSDNETLSSPNLDNPVATVSHPGPSACHNPSADSAVNPLSLQISGLDKRTASKSSLSGSIVDSKMSHKDAEESGNLVNHPKQEIRVSLAAAPEQTNSTPDNSVGKDIPSGSLAFTEHTLDSDSRANHSDSIRTHPVELSPTPEEDRNSQRSVNSGYSRSYIPYYLLPRRLFSVGSEKEIKSEDHSKESSSPHAHSNKEDTVPQILAEEVPDGDLLTPPPAEKLVAASPTTSWSDYLKFPTTAVSGPKMSNSDTVPLPVSPKPDELSTHPNIETIPPVPSNTSNGSWLTPWTWWRPDLQFNSSNLIMEPALASVHPEMDSGSSQGNTQIINTSPDPINHIGASQETRAGWLSVLASTNARRKAVKEQGEVMEVMIAEEESPVVQTKSAISDNKVTQPDPQPNVADRIFESIKHDASAAPSVVSNLSQSPDYLILPTFEDTFCNPPRSVPLPKEESTLHRTVKYVAKMLFNDDPKGKGKEKEPFGKELPKPWSVLGDDPKKILKDVKRVVVIGIHGWFPGAFVRQFLGEPTGTSEKFATMLEKTVREYFEEHGIALEKLTKIIFQGGGTITERVNSFFQEYLNHDDWVNDLQTADAILFGTHSQGSIVTTEFVDRLIKEGHIRTSSSSLLASISAPQHVGILALCGVHNGPLLYLNTNTLTNSYIQRFESAAARELFEFQDSESPVSKTYVAALSNCLHHGVKFTYIASLNDQVVPIYSGAFITASHPLILRALYIDGDAYHSTDFLSNLLVLLFKIRNAGLHDSGLIAHLSEATAGSLTGVGHSKAYEAPASYKLAVRFLFETSGLIGSNQDLVVEPFTARAARNDYEIPWALRDLIANPDVAALFSSEFSSLRSAFDEWRPRTAVLRDVRRKLEPIRRLNTAKL